MLVRRPAATWKRGETGRCTLRWCGRCTVLRLETECLCTLVHVCTGVDPVCLAVPEETNGGDVLQALDFRKRGARILHGQLAADVRVDKFAGVIIVRMRSPELWFQLTDEGLDFLCIALHLDGGLFQLLAVHSGLLLPLHVVQALLKLRFQGVDVAFRVIDEGRDIRLLLSLLLLGGELLLPLLELLHLRLVCGQLFLQ